MHHEALLLSVCSLLHVFLILFGAVYDAGHANGVLEKSSNGFHSFHLVFLNPVGQPRRDEIELNIPEHMRLLVGIHGVDAGGGEADDGPLALDNAAAVEEEAVGFVGDHQLVLGGLEDGVA